MGAGVGLFNPCIIMFGVEHIRGEIINVQHIECAFDSIITVYNPIFGLRFEHINTPLSIVEICRNAFVAPVMVYNCR